MTRLEEYLKAESSLLDAIEVEGSNREKVDGLQDAVDSLWFGLTDEERRALSGRRFIGGRFYSEPR